MYCLRILICNLLVYLSWVDASTFSKKDILEFRNEVTAMFYHAYDGYIKYAMPYDELRPLTCDGHDTWGSYSLTLIDALDTLAVMGNKTEFQRIYHLISERRDFDSDINVSVFETNIRIVGGLLSGHLMARRMGIQVGSEWPCSGPLLRLAVDAATRLLPAFDTSTGMPYGTVNLRHGVPQDETTVTCTAGVGTFIIEFGTISRLTGDPLFEKVALRAIHALWARRSRIGLFGNHIDVQTGLWTDTSAGIGAGVDSFYEYLVKASFLFNRPELMDMFKAARKSIDKHLRHEDWYLWATMSKGHVSMSVFQSLEAFWPGVLTLVGDLDSAQKTLYNYHLVLKQYGFHPEFYNIPQSTVHSKRKAYPLRPEFSESLVYLYQATKDQSFLAMGADLVKSIEHSAKTPCGYATIRDVSDHSVENRMESFFLAETTKYLYLLFHEDHWLHSSGGSGKLWSVGDRSCVIEGGGGYFFNTEAHPIDTSALKCCSGPTDSDLYISQDDLVQNLLDPSQQAFKYEPIGHSSLFDDGHDHNDDSILTNDDKSSFNNDNSSSNDVDLTLTNDDKSSFNNDNSSSNDDYNDHSSSGYDNHFGESVGKRENSSFKLIIDDKPENVSSESALEEAVIGVGSVEEILIDSNSDSDSNSRSESNDSELLNDYDSDSKSVNNDSTGVNDHSKSVNDDSTSVNDDSKSVNDHSKSVNDDSTSVNDDSKSVNDDSKSVTNTIEPKSTQEIRVENNDGNCLKRSMKNEFKLILSLYYSSYTLQCPVITDFVKIMDSMDSSSLNFRKTHSVEEENSKKQQEDTVLNFNAKFLKEIKKNASWLMKEIQTLINFSSIVKTPKTQSTSAATLVLTKPPQEQVPEDLVKGPREKFSLESFRKRINKLNLRKWNLTDFQLLTCPVNLDEYFIFKGQMIQY